ncbi:FAD-dependent thymidylate synthase [Rhodococcus fascians]|nr:FAD-dependent thymidylate synthase [Rhodococcus fascians]MBY4237713.1 FAD-dependent thymidylate synthase [Rhodococcus fascians]MBY4253916.1 FAD-dependent thymidylate synthase [Rhodococcus fascians]MBY4269213.1 FAD-dependent thymidylate synthase [Rhodococcus fascians]
MQLIASTQFHGVDGFTPDETLAPDDAQHVIEAAGRACYMAFNKPNPATRANKNYIANIIKSRHASVLEHATATFFITGVSRNLTHELIRHRMASYSEISQRYVDARKLSIVRPPGFGNGDWLWLQKARDHALDSYQSYVSRGKASGVVGKKAREAARAFLPSSTETQIVVTANYRAWIEILQKRDDPAADAEIRGLAQEIGRQLAVLAPHVFGPAARRLWSWDTSQEAPKGEQT